jgi:O-antigen/teichoic acid export membrane protein
MLEAAPPATLRRQLSAGAVWTATGLGVTAATSFLLTVVLARVMTRGDYGTLSTALAAVGLANVVVGAGLYQAVAHVAAVQSQRRGSDGVNDATAAGLSLAWWMAAAIVAAAAAGGAAQVLLAQHPTGLAIVLLSLTPMVAAFPLTGVLNGALVASHRPRAFAFGLFINACVTIPMIAVLVLVGQRSPVAVGVTKTAAAIATLGFLAFYYRTAIAARVTHGAPGIAADGARTLRREIRRTVPAMVLMGAFGAAISQLDVLLVGLLRGPHAAAIYQPTSRILDLIAFLLASLVPFFLTLASRAAARGESDTVASLQHWASRWALVLGVPILAPLLVVPAAVLHVVFGHSYPAPETAERLLGVAGVAATTLGFAGYSLAALGSARLSGRILAAFLVLDLVACIVLIPLFGISGAAAATSGSLVSSSVVCGVVLWRQFGIVPWNRQWLATGAAFAVSLPVARILVTPVAAELARSIAVAVIVGAVTLCAAYASSDASERRAIARLAQHLVPGRGR